MKLKYRIMQNYVRDNCVFTEHLKENTHSNDSFHYILMSQNIMTTHRWSKKKSWHFL